MLQVAPIGTLLSPEQMLGARVQYRHFASQPDELYTGIVIAAQNTRLGVEVIVQPDAVSGMNLLPKARNLKTDVIGFAWWDAPNNETVIGIENAA